MKYAKAIAKNEEADDTVAEELPEKRSVFIKSTSDVGFNFMKSPLNHKVEIIT